MLLKLLECQVSKFVNSDTCPRPTTGLSPGRNLSRSREHAGGSLFTGSSVYVLDSAPVPRSVSSGLQTASGRDHQHLLSKQSWGHSPGRQRFASPGRADRNVSPQRTVRQREERERREERGGRRE